MRIWSYLLMLKCAIKAVNIIVIIIIIIISSSSSSSSSKQSRLWRPLNMKVCRLSRDV